MQEFTACAQELWMFVQIVVTVGYQSIVLFARIHASGHLGQGGLTSRCNAQTAGALIFTAGCFHHLFGQRCPKCNILLDNYGLPYSLKSVEEFIERCCAYSDVFRE